jgi:hypothetical protein
MNLLNLPAPTARGVVLKNGDRRYIMATNPSVNDKLKKISKDRRALKKREKELKLELKLEGVLKKDLVKWKKIMALRDACNKLIKDADLRINMNMKKLDKYPEYYEYQHPTKKTLKTNNRQEEWVRFYCGDEPNPKGGSVGVEEDLLSTAKKSRLSALKRGIVKKSKRAKLLSKLSKIGEFKRTPPAVAEKKSGFFNRG